jgi:hypothetical protein
MADSPGFELAGNLVLRAKSAGYDIDTGQIARWNRAGLLPKPRQHGLGQGNGSDVRYPLGTGDQLMVLCWIHRRFRKLEAVGWYLWLNGFSVDSKYFRPVLINAVQYLELNLRTIRTKVFDIAYDIVSLRPNGERFLESLATLRTDNHHFRRARRRVGAGQIGEFCRIVLTLATGAYRADSEHNEQDRETDRAMLVKGFGLSRAWIDRTDDGTTLLTGDIRPDLERLSMRLAKLTKRRMLAAIMSNKIETARDELRLFMAGLTFTYHEYEKTYGPGAFGLAVIAAFGTIIDIQWQAILILLFETVIRSDPHNSLREILAAIESKCVGNGRKLALPPNH